mgnify:CR=1 FL=1
MRILAILFFTASIVGCSNGNKNSNSKIENNESNVIDEQVTEQELPKESKLFNELLSLTQNLDQFKGTAFVGSLDGPCYMVLTSNSQGDNIAKLRYQINNYYQGKADKVDETYTLIELKRKSAKKDGFGLNNTRDYEDTYLYGSIKGLKASINDGAITDGSGSGNVWFVLDSVDYELTYVMASSANWSFQGSIKLEVEQYIKLKELFTNKKLSENEVKAISKSQDLIELSSNDTNFIALGNNKYKVLISKKELIANQRKDMHGNKVDWSAETAITPLFKCKIKNVSNKNIDKVAFGDLFPTLDHLAYGRNSYGRHIYWFLEGSTLWDYFPSQNISNDQGFEFVFNLTINSSRWHGGHGPELEYLGKNIPMNEILNDNEFLRMWNGANSSPAIKLYVHDLDRDEWQDIPVEIYFELVD